MVFGAIGDVVEEVGQWANNNLNPFGGDEQAQFGSVNSDLGKLTQEQARNAQKARAAAQKYRIPETNFVRLLMAEGSLKNDPGGNGGGIGQFIESTANRFGTTQAELRRNPDKAIDLAAKYIAQNIERYDGDAQKGFIAYFLGEGNVDKAVKEGGNQWLSHLNEIAKQYNQGSATSYLNKVGFGIYEGDGQAPITTNQKRTNGYSDLSKMPNPADFYTTDEDGTQYFDDMAFSSAIQAHQAWMQSRQMEREYQLGPASQVIDDIIAEIGLQISAGNLDLNKANSLFKTQVDSYQMALDAFEGEAFKYGTPAGAQYQSGFEPDSYNVTQLGLAPKNNIGPTVDPLAKAMELAGMGQSMIGGVQVPGVPDVSGMRQQMFADEGAMPGGNGFYRSSESLGGNSNIDPGINRTPESIGGNSNPEGVYGGAGGTFGRARQDPKSILQAALQRAHEQTLLARGG